TETKTTLGVVSRHGAHGSALAQGLLLRRHGTDTRAGVPRLPGGRSQLWRIRIDVWRPTILRRGTGHYPLLVLYMRPSKPAQEVLHDHIPSLYRTQSSTTFGRTNFNSLVEEHARPDSASIEALHLFSP